MRRPREADRPGPPARPAPPAPPAPAAQIRIDRLGSRCFTDYPDRRRNGTPPRPSVSRRRTIWPRIGLIGGSTRLQPPSDRLRRVQQLPPDRLRRVQQLTPDRLRRVQQLTPDRLTSFRDLNHAPASPSSEKPVQPPSDRLIRVQQLTPDRLIVFVIQITPRASAEQLQVDPVRLGQIGRFPA